MCLQALPLCFLVCLSQELAVCSPAASIDTFAWSGLRENAASTTGNPNLFRVFLGSRKTCKSGGCSCVCERERERERDLNVEGQRLEFYFFFVLFPWQDRCISLRLVYEHDHFFVCSHYSCIMDQVLLQCLSDSVFVQCCHLYFNLLFFVPSTWLACR